jgi:hypothetical protein
MTEPGILDTFDESAALRWGVLQQGQGRVHKSNGALALVNLPTPEQAYSNAQIDDYSYYRVSNADAINRVPTKSATLFRWRAPLRMRVRARSMGEMRGTAGFGFWNNPFNPTGGVYRLPRATWFFYGSPPNNMALARGVVGWGWKCATFDAINPLFFALLPFAPLGVLLMRVPALYQRLWDVGQRALGVSEHRLGDTIPIETHTYELEWRRDSVTFVVDGATVHQSPYSPRGALGFLAWVDNQYAVVTPQGRFGWGVLPLEREQGMVIEEIQIEPIGR